MVLTRRRAALAVPSLDNVPDELLTLVLERCTCDSLARLALTNSDWAARIAIVQTSMWKSLAEAKQQWNAVKSFDDMEELWDTLKDRYVLLPPWRKPNAFVGVDVTHIRDPLSFATMYSAHRPYFAQGFDALSVESVRFRWAKEKLDLYDMRCKTHKWYDPYSTDTFKPLVIAASVRLSPTAFHELVRTWITLPLVEQLMGYSQRDGCWALFDFIGTALARSLKRAQWTVTQLVDLFRMIQSSVDDRERFPSISELPESIVVSTVLGFVYVRCGNLGSVFQRTCLEAICTLKPFTDPNNQRFWFELTHCEIDGDEVMYDPREGFGRIYLEHIKNLPVAALSALVDVVVQEEDAFWERQDQHDPGDDPYEDTCGTLLHWANANLRFNSDTSVGEDEEIAFFALLASMHGVYKPIISHKAMSWVSAAAAEGDLAAVQRISDALR